MSKDHENELLRVKNDVQSLRQQKNLVMQALLQRINQQQHLIQALSHKQNIHQDMITTTMEHLDDTGYIYTNYQTNKKYMLLDMSSLGSHDIFMYQRCVAITSYDTQTWENVVYPHIKQKVQYADSYCEMLINDIHKLQTQVAQMKTAIQVKQYHHSKQAGYQYIQNCSRGKTNNSNPYSKNNDHNAVDAIIQTQGVVIDQYQQSATNSAPSITKYKEDPKLNYREQTVSHSINNNTQSEQSVSPDKWKNLFPLYQQNIISNNSSNQHQQSATVKQHNNAGINKQHNIHSKQLQPIQAEISKQIQAFNQTEVDYVKATNPNNCNSPSNNNGSNSIGKNRQAADIVNYVINNQQKQQKQKHVSFPNKTNNQTSLQKSLQLRHQQQQQTDSHLLQQTPIKAVNNDNNMNGNNKQAGDVNNNDGKVDPDEDSAQAKINKYGSSFKTPQPKNQQSASNSKGSTKTKILYIRK